MEDKEKIFKDPLASLPGDFLDKKGFNVAECSNRSAEFRLERKMQTFGNMEQRDVAKYYRQRHDLITTLTQLNNSKPRHGHYDMVPNISHRPAVSSTPTKSLPASHDVPIATLTSPQHTDHTLSSPRSCRSVTSDANKSDTNVSHRDPKRSPTKPKRIRRQHFDVDVPMDTFTCRTLRATALTSVHNGASLERIRRRLKNIKTGSSIPFGSQFPKWSQTSLKLTKNLSEHSQAIPAMPKIVSSKAEKESSTSLPNSPGNHRKLANQTVWQNAAKNVASKRRRSRSSPVRLNMVKPWMVSDWPQADKEHLLQLMHDYRHKLQIKVDQFLAKPQPE